MKKTLFTWMIGFTFVFPVELIFAQNSQKNIVPDYKTNLLPSIHHLAILQNHDLTGARLLTRNEINIWAVRDFVNRFEKVENVLWFADPKAGFEAYFVQDGYGDRVIYDKAGGWQSTRLTYQEERCPRDIRTAVKSLFFDFEIILIEEVRMMEGGEFIFYLQDKSSIKIVRVNKDGEVEVLQEFNR